MPELLSIQLRIPGQWRDIWLYKNRIYLWDRIGLLRYLDMEAAYKKLAKNYGLNIAFLVQQLIFRNDWKVGEQTRLMLQIPELESAFLRPFRGNDRIVLELPENLFGFSGSEAYREPVLDSYLYANRLYLATLNGLFESYIHPRHPDREYELNQQLDRRVSRLAVGYAAINASAEDDGLLFGRIRFAADESADDSLVGRPGFKPSTFRRVADYSLSSSYAGRNLLNYTQDAAPSLLRSRIEERPAQGTARFDDVQVIGYEQESELLTTTQSTLSDLGQGTPPAELDIKVLGNSNSHILASVAGRLHVVNLRVGNENRDVRLQPVKSYREASRIHVNLDEVLETYPISSGFAIELEDSIKLMTRSGSYNLLKGAAARVRTFVESRRHKEVVAVVQEESVSLIGFHISEETLF